MQYIFGEIGEQSKQKIYTYMWFWTWLKITCDSISRYFSRILRWYGIGEKPLSIASGLTPSCVTPFPEQSPRRIFRGK